MQAAARSMEPDSAGNDVFMQHKVSHTIIKIALELTPQPGRYLRSAPGDTALYTGLDGLGLRQFVGQEPQSDRGPLPPLSIDALRASFTFVDGGAVLAAEARGTLVMPAIDHVGEQPPAYAPPQKPAKKDKKDKKAKDKEKKEKKDKKEKKSKEKSKEKEKDKASGKRKRSEELA